MSVSFFDPPRRRDSLRFQVMIDGAEGYDYQGRVLHLETGREYPFDGVLDMLDTIRHLLSDQNRLPPTHRTRTWSGEEDGTAQIEENRG